jgi:hypothetical protein
MKQNSYFIHPQNKEFVFNMPKISIASLPSAEGFGFKKKLIKDER